MGLGVAEYGGIDGLVTIEDLVEEIVGESEDEQEKEEVPVMIERPDGSIEASARTTIEDFEARFGEVVTPEEREENDTLGGLVFSLAGRVPLRGEVIRHAGGLEFEVLDADLPAFRAALLRERHTLKRALTDPRLLSGIGNAYSDEILHAARLSPLQLTSNLTADETERLYAATRDTLTRWIARLRDETGDAFPEKVTAFREGMAVHGRYRKPCPDCGAPVQRIVHAENETNYCATCQTGGKLLADRSLSRLLKEAWPRSLAELEEVKKARRE